MLAKTNPKQEGTLTVSPAMFLAKVGAANPQTVLLSEADAATVAYWRQQVRAGRPIMAAITFDGQGNVLEADGRHRALAASLEGIARIAVRVTRRESGHEMLARIYGGN